MTIAARLQQVRGDESRRTFSARVGVHPNTVGNYEKDREPPVSYVAAVAERYGIRLEWLISGRGPMRNGDEEPTYFQERLAVSICAAINGWYGEDPATPPLLDRARVLRSVTQYLLQIGVIEGGIPDGESLVGIVKLTGGLLGVPPPRARWSNR